jgi:acetoin utilization deacetylase AcuC-like enzyme
MTRLAVYYSPLALAHDTGVGVFDTEPSPLMAFQETNAENAHRIENMHSVLERGPHSKRIDWHEAPVASLEQLKRFHEPDYLEELRSIPANESRRFENTTVFGPGTWQAILAAAGQAIAAVDHVWSGRGDLAYALVRPPGHHAQPAMADGYCFVNNIGVAIEEARTKGLRRVAVIDWDVHHGNGTQEGFYADPDVLTVSIHMDHGAWGPTHSQTGAPEEAGRGDGVGANWNVALPFGSGDALHHAAFDRIAAPAIEAFGPELIVVACGQDANQFDPNGRQCVSMAGFHGLGARARELAGRCCDGRLALVQEGGYSISYSALCLNATLDGVLGEDLSLPDPIAFLPDSTAGIDATLSDLERRRRASLERG